MEDLYFNLAKEEFSKGRKILLWIMAILSALVTLWDTYLKFFRHDSTATSGLTITLLVVTAFLFLIAILASANRKEHFFKIDNQEIAYHYGLMFQTHRRFNWTEISKIYVPPHSKNVILVLGDGRVIKINLTWVEKTKSRLIRKHIYYTAKNKGIEIFKEHLKKD